MLKKILNFQFGLLLGVVLVVSCGDKISNTIAEVIGPATDVSYSSSSGLESTTVQDAIDEVADRVTLLDMKDSDIEELLIGTWTGTGVNGAREATDISVTFNDDGTYACSGSNPDNDNMIFTTSSSTCAEALEWGVYHRSIWFEYQVESGTPKNFFMITRITESEIEIIRLGGTVNIYVLSKNDD